MNAEQLITELKAEGFDYLSNEKALNYLNSSYLVDICEEEDWDFLQDQAEGTSPLEIPDLSAVETVVDLAQLIELRPLERKHIVADVNTNLATEGSPYYYYLTFGTTVNAFPVAPNPIQVRYWKVPTELSGTNVPLLPPRFHSLIVDGAVARAYENSDDYELRDAKRTIFQERLMQMKEALGAMHRDGPSEYIEVNDLESLF